MSLFGQKQNFTVEQLQKEIETGVSDVQKDIMKYKKESLYGQNSGVFATNYEFFGYGCEYWVYDPYPALNCVSMKDKDDPKITFMYKNLEKAAMNYAKEKGLSKRSYDDGKGKKGYTFTNSGDEVFRIAKNDKFNYIEIFGGTVDASVARYFGSVVCWTYQSSSAPITDYDAIEVINLYAKQKPNWTEDQFIEYARSHTPEQISRRNFIYRGKVAGTEDFGRELEMQKKAGKIVYVQTLYLD